MIFYSEQKLVGRFRELMALLVLLTRKKAAPVVRMDSYKAGCSIKWRRGCCTVLGIVASREATSTRPYRKAFAVWRQGRWLDQSVARCGSRCAANLFDQSPGESKCEVMLG